MFARLFAPTVVFSANCDLPWGLYDPALGRMEAVWVKANIGMVA
jgi:hypothetical protein